MNLKLKRRVGIIACGFLISSLLFQIKDIKTVSANSNDAQVKLGIDKLENNLTIFEGKKVGLITNPSGMDSNFKSSIDVLYEKTNLTTLFAAEHGIRGNAQAGDNVENGVDETGLDTWVMPSPNMPTLDTAIVYTGTCVFEGTNVSEGRGTTRPFELIGAPWINAIDLANKLNSLKLSGVKFRAASFTPQFSKYSSADIANYPTGKNQVCGGVQVYVTDRDRFNAVKTGYAMLYTIRDMYPDKFQYLGTNFIDKLTGNSYVREGKYTLEELFEIVDKESDEFKSDIEKYRIYVPAATIDKVPVITVNDKTLEVNQNFNPLKDVTAYDEEDGDLTESIQVIDNTVDMSKVGEYVVSYSISDSNGATTTKKINIKVIETVKDDSNNNENKDDDHINNPEDNTNSNSGKLPQTGTALNNSLVLVGLSLFIIYIGKLSLGKKCKKY